MEISESSESADADYTPAVPLEISQEVAEQTDEVLRELAEDAGLETALVVDQSGALVTGISAEENVTVEVISALVAGASGAMKTLVRELGETGEIESLHQGSERTVYLREIVGRFILVGVAEASLPVGVIREKSNQVREKLTEVLASVNVVEPLPNEAPETIEVPKSLREVAMTRAAERAAQEPEGEPDEDSLAGLIDDPVSDEDDDVFDLEKLTAVDGEENAPGEEGSDGDPVSIFEIADEEEETVDEEQETVEEEREPTEVLEPLDLDESEIVIEKADGTTVASPFEMEEDEEESPVLSSPIILEEGEPVESIFELEADEEEVSGADEEKEEEAEPEEASSGSSLNEDLSNIFEVDSDEKKEESIFEADDEDPEAEGSEIVFELDADDGDEEPDEDEAESAEEEEVRGSGPFYF